jgi:hypothetical protein
MSQSQSDVQSPPLQPPALVQWPERARAWLLAGTGLLIVLLTVVRADVFWHNEAYLDDASGNWTALARDLSAGVLYRPLSGPDGFGGSRYFPAHIVLHAAVMRVVGDPVRSGQIVAALAMGLLVSGTYVLLRRLGTGMLVSAASASFVLVAHPAQEALLAIKGDGLSAAFNVWGLAVCLAAATGGAGVFAAAMLFALAFAAKVTTVSGLGAAVLWLWTGGRRAAALQLLVLTAGGMAVVLGLMYVGSGGRVFDVMRASASGGAGLRDLLQAPLTLAKQTRRVPETLAFVQLGGGALILVLLRAAPWRNPAAWFFVCVLGVTTVIFGSPGTDTNHLLDLHVASIVLVASLIPAVRSAGVTDFAWAALAVAALAASLSLVSGLANAKGEQRRGRLADTLALIPDRSRPILAQNPLVPVAAGQRAFILDPFMIRLNVQKDPAFGDSLWRAIRNQEFSAVVFERDPDTARDLYKVILGERFVDEVEQHYVVAGHVGLRTIFLPRPR